MPLYLGLVHYPVYNKNRKKIASAVTTLDLHDLARLARTFDIRRFFVITPLKDQRELVERVRRHWINGYGARYNPDRSEAIDLVCPEATIDGVVRDIEKEEIDTPLLLATDAEKGLGKIISYRDARAFIEDRRAVLLLFGTAWGLHSSVIEKADYLLPPILGERGYNHLSVRTAAAVIIDRLVGRS